LRRDLIRAAIVDADIRALMSDIDKSDLADQREAVKIVMHALSLEDLTKIWSSFFKTASYRTSISCKATVVLLDGKEDARTTMPVRERNIYAAVPRKPEIRYVEPQMVDGSLLDSASGVIINVYGNSLKNNDVKIDLEQNLKVDEMPSPESSTDEKLVVKLPATLAIGIRQIKVIHPMLLGTPNTLHKGYESNASIFAVVPKILDLQPGSIHAGAKLMIKFKPEITKGQEVKAIIGTHKPLPGEWTSTTDTSTDTVEVEISPDITKGEHPVRLRVDGAESQPDKDVDNEYKRKTVTII
jgi:hypothetical protein